MHDILNDLRSRFETKHAKSDFQLGRELLLLGEHEKLLIKRRVLGKKQLSKIFKNKNIFLPILGFEYNVGALRTLQLLVKARVLEFFDYLHAQTPADVQGIITDVMDCESAEDLLVELLNNLKSDEAISSTYKECFKQYVEDLVNRPELIKYEFIASVEPRLPKDVFCDNISEGLLEELCLQPLNMVGEMSEVLSKQKDWNNQFKDERFKILAGLLRQLSISHAEDVSKMIAKKLQGLSNLNWFFVLLFMKNLKPGSSDDLKSGLKNSRTPLCLLMSLKFNSRIPEGSFQAIPRNEDR